MIEGVDGFKPELQRLAFSDAKVFMQAKVGIEETRPCYVANGTGSEIPGKRVRNARRIDPLDIRLRPGDGSCARRCGHKLIHDMNWSRAVGSFGQSCGANPVGS